MPFINPKDGHLTVMNLLKTDSAEKQQRLLGAARQIIDQADFPGWVSSTIHSGQDRFGTLNFIQWRSAEDLAAWYAGQIFQHHDMALFLELLSVARLLQAEAEVSQCRPGLGDVAEISPDRDDYTVVEVLDVAPESQSALIVAFGDAHEWLLETPGYRSQSVLRGVRARGPEGENAIKEVGAENSFVVVYSQWDSKEAYDAFRAVPAEQQSPARRATEIKRNALTVSSDWNSYRVEHSGSAA
ncbi:antibiotic biosynthesis monooxygenase [Streptomyces sp. CG1]|uniref:antibiotic biosynthesis monooxygenase family protein n=1 Tax=Streptomyces sp. CG1 TaxID=1287523 RepID=UPI0034E2F281